MSDCPAYLAVTITDLLLHDELFRYDLLILCPSTFNVSFRFPTSTTTPDLMTSSFDVHLSDAVMSHRIYLTRVNLRHVVDADDDVDDVERSEAIASGGPVGSSSSWDQYMLVYIVSAVVLAVLALMFAFIHASQHVRPARRLVLTPDVAVSPSRTYHWCVNGHVGLSSAAVHTSASTFYNVNYACDCHSADDARSVRVVSTHRYRLLVCAYASLWLITGLLATFNVFFYVVSVLVDRDWQQMAAVTGSGPVDVVLHRQTAETNLSRVIDAHRRHELRQYRDGTAQRVHACRNHVDNTIRRTSAILVTESAQLTDIGRSMAALTAEEYGRRLKAYGARVDAFAAALETKLTNAIGRTMHRYGAYVNSLINNVWLRFAVDVFNSTRHISPPVNHLDNYGLSNQAVAGFGSFLDVDEINQVELWVSRFWQRYEIGSFYFLFRICLIDVLCVYVTSSSYFRQSTVA